MKGLICKVRCRFKYGTSFIVKFKKGYLYSIVKRGDGGWWLVNHEEKKRIDMRYITSSIIRNYFIPYQPIKKRSRYEKWKKS